MPVLTIGGSPVAGSESFPAAEPVRLVSWTECWKRLRHLGFTDRGEVMAAISGWSHDPDEVWQRARKAKEREIRQTGKRLTCWQCNGPRELGIACPACGALPVVAREAGGA